MHARQSWRTIGAALLLVVWTASLSARAQEAMSPDRFAAYLADLSAQVSGGAPGQVPDVRVPAVWVVEAGDQRFEVPAVWLTRAVGEAKRDIATWPARRQEMLTRIEALRVEAQALAAREGVNGAAQVARARDALEEVLSRPEFRGMARDSAFEALRQRVMSAVEQVLRWLGAGAAGQRSAATALAWITTLLAIGVLVAWVVRLLRPTKDAVVHFAGAPDHVTRSARGWARQAREANDPREAIRCAYRAAIALLEEEGVWSRDATRTPREYARLLPAGHRRGGVFRDVARRFEEIWFAARPATDEDRSAVLGHLRELGCLTAE